MQPDSPILRCGEATDSAGRPGCTQHTVKEPARPHRNGTAGRVSFAENIMENIRYGRPDATDEEVVEAAKRANAHDFIAVLPDGYYTDIGQRGVKLSGGQKQRLSIARVFLKNPPILILMKPPRPWTMRVKKIVQNSLEELAKNRTTFVIAHRLTTIRNAQRILVLTEKGIEEEGTHKELLERNGAYAALYRQ